MKLNFVSLLHIDDNPNNFTNFSIKSQSPLRTYIRNAITLSNSLALHGHKHTILTNNKEYLYDFFEDEAKILNVEVIEFIINIPKYFKFYSAHFKLDVFRYAAKQENDVYTIILDLDVFSTGKNFKQLENFVNNRAPLIYSLNDQVIPAHGIQRIQADINSLTSSNFDDIRWCGGEFIGGPPEFYSDLLFEINRILPKYIQNSSSYHHIGDEILTTAAICFLRSKYEISDAGANRFIYRHWSAKTKHKKKSIFHALDHSFIHLPSDKEFLEEISVTKNSTFPVSKYFIHRIKIIYIKIKKIIVK